MRENSSAHLESPRAKSGCLQVSLSLGTSWVAASDETGANNVLIDGVVGVIVIIRSILSWDISQRDKTAEETCIVYTGQKAKAQERSRVDDFFHPRWKVEEECIFLQGASSSIRFVEGKGHLSVLLHSHQQFIFGPSIH